MDTSSRSGRLSTNCTTSHVKLKLVAGSLVGATEYDHVYDGINEKDDNESDSHSFHNSVTLILMGVAREVARCGGHIVEKKQYFTYEVICTTFFLSLVDDGLNHAL